MCQELRLTERLSDSFDFNWFETHPFPVTTYATLGVVAMLESIQAILGWRRGTPWTGHQFVTGPRQGDKQASTLTCTPPYNLELRVNPTCMSLNRRRNPEYQEGTHEGTGRTCRIHSERHPGRNWICNFHRTTVPDESVRVQKLRQIRASLYQIKINF